MADSSGIRTCCARALPGSCLLLLVLLGGVLGQEWVLPERSQANLDALARVDLRTDEMPQADGAEISAGRQNIDKIFAFLARHHR